MSHLNNEQLVLTIGGAFTATMFGYILKGINMVIDFGRSIGSSLRRLFSGKLCSLQ